MFDLLKMPSRTINEAPRRSDETILQVGRSTQSHLYYVVRTTPVCTRRASELLHCIMSRELSDYCY